MSLVRKDYGVVLEVFVNSKKTFELTVKDPNTSLALDMSDTATFSTGVVKVVKPDGTIVASMDITFTNRVNGLINFTILDTDTILANAGNWTGNLEILDDGGDVVEQQNFNFNILESY